MKLLFIGIIMICLIPITTTAQSFSLKKAFQDNPELPLLNTEEVRLKNPRLTRIVGISTFVVGIAFFPISFITPTLVSIYSEQNASYILNKLLERTLIPVYAITAAIIYYMISPKGESFYNIPISKSDAGYLVIGVAATAYYLTHGIIEIVKSTQFLEDKNNKRLESVSMTANYEPVSNTPLVGFKISF